MKTLVNFENIEDDHTMAIPSKTLIKALRETAKRVMESPRYEWGHMGRCSCGFLVTTLTEHTPGAVHQAAMIREGDWSEQANLYCKDSGFAIDDIVNQLLDFGLNVHDIHDLEWLSNTLVLEEVGRQLVRNEKEDVFVYLMAWASLLEKDLDDQDNEGPSVHAA